jgi:hypothetical protein
VIYDERCNGAGRIHIDAVLVLRELTRKEPWVEERSGTELFGFVYNVLVIESRVRRRNRLASGESDNDGKATS